MSEPLELLPSFSREESQAIARRRRGRNLAMLVLLLGLVGLFYAIAVVKLGSTVMQPH